MEMERINRFYGAEFLSLLWNKTVHCRVHKSLPVLPRPEGIEWLSNNNKKETEKYRIVVWKS